MATTRTVNLHPTIGSLWQAFVTRWTVLLVDGGYTITAGTEPATGLPDARAWYIQGVKGADTVRDVYCAMDIALSSSKTPILYIANSPGWRAQPLLLLPTFGATDTLTSFQGIVAATRARIWNECCTGTTPTYTTQSNTLAGGNYTVSTLSAPINKLYASVVDVLALTRVTTAWTSAYVGQAQQTDGLGVSPTYPSFSAPSLEGVVQALQDIAGGETQASFNNGAYTVLIRSGDQMEIP